MDSVSSKDLEYKSTVITQLSLLPWANTWVFIVNSSSY